jgi:hypothetical protein
MLARLAANFAKLWSARGNATALHSAAHEIFKYSRFLMLTRLAANFAKLWSARGNATALGGRGTVTIAQT